MTSIWLCNLLGNLLVNKGQDWGNLVFAGFLVGIFTLTTTAGVYANQTANQTQGANISNTFPGGLALHLKKQGFKMYGAYWCPHCQDQKAMFGEASKQVPYVECAPGTATSQTEICQQRQIQSFPTWEVNGKLIEGVQSLADLAQMSGFVAN
jgi:glutaredoxin